MISQELDIVVLGGGGHVGLPLSLTLADAGLRVGIYDTNQATLDRIGRGQMPFLRRARTTCFVVRSRRDGSNSAPTVPSSGGRAN